MGIGLLLFIFSSLSFGAVAPKLSAVLHARLKVPPEVQAEQLVVWAEKSPLSGAASAANVAQRSTGFAPASVAVKQGARLTFENLDSVAHNAFSLDAGEQFDLGMQLPKTKVLEHQFQKPGRYHVFCNIHPTMHLVVNVLSHASMAKPATNGDFELPWKGKEPDSFRALVDGPGWSEPRPVLFLKSKNGGFEGELGSGIRANSPPKHTRKDGTVYPPEGSSDAY